VAKHTPGQLPLELGDRSRGTVERACAADLTEMGRAGLLPSSTAGVQKAYRAAGRELDRCIRERDRWGGIAVSRELRALRDQLGIQRPTSTRDDVREALEQLSATAVRHPA
jgi:hypothetical protein